MLDRMNDMSSTSLLDRVRKRRFVQWIIAYIAAAWVALQAAGLLFDIFGFADSGLRRLAVALVFGCGIVAVLAWLHG